MGMLEAAVQVPVLSAEAVFFGYQGIRQLLPEADFNDVSTELLPNLMAIADRYDVFVFDAFGVLNVGSQPVAGAAGCLQQLTDEGKEVFLLSNGASLTRKRWLQRLQGMGFRLHPEQLINSRDTLLDGCTDLAKMGTLGVMLPPGAEADDLPADLLRPGDRDFFEADLFLFLSADDWHLDLQGELIRALRKRPRLLLLGNPDLAAPRDDGLSPQPGYYVLQHWPSDLADLVVPFGKPFPDIFSLLKRSLAPAVAARPQRILMIGDTLHTDILGGRAAGFHTALVTGQGSLTGLDIDTCIHESGIVPHYCLPAI